MKTPDVSIIALMDKVLADQFAVEKEVHLANIGAGDQSGDAQATTALRPGGDDLDLRPVARGDGVAVSLFTGVGEGHSYPSYRAEHQRSRE